MKKKFESYGDYYVWIIKNWRYNKTDLDQEIIKSGFVIEIDHLGKKDYRLMFKSEFIKKLKNE